MLKIEGKTFMNIQEAVQWLLDNNALPFQCTANYAGNTEIGMGTIVNPSPAKVRIGSLIFFADSKVSTVVGITENGFICSDQYNNLVDDIAYVTSVAINASGHLITTLSDGQTIDAGIIKQVSSFSINASQELIANYNDGTSTNLGLIFNGDITVNTIEQAQANYKGSNINFNPGSSGLTFTNTYNRLEVINQVLYAVVNLKVENNSGSSKTFSGTDMLTTIPTKYAEKIIDVKGKNVHEVASPDYTFITGEPAMAIKNSETFATTKLEGTIYLCNRVAENGISLFVRLNNTETLADGEYLYFTGRIALTLI